MKPSEAVVIAGRRAEWIRRFDPHYCNSDPILSDYLKVFEFVTERFDEGSITHDKLKALGFDEMVKGYEWRMDSGKGPMVELTLYEKKELLTVFDVLVGESKFRVKTMKQLRDILAVWGIE